MLGSSYTINPNVPMLNLASVMQDSVKKEKEGDNSETVLYRISLLFLFIYFIIAAVSTAYPSIAFVNCLALMLLDSLHKALSKGDTHWSPAYKIFLLVMGRLLIMSCDGRTWLMNYCLAYIVYSIAFVDEKTNSVTVKFIGIPNRQSADLFINYVMVTLGVDYQPIEHGDRSKMIH